MINHCATERKTCNDLFSRFEQQILFLEKQAEMTEPTTDRHGHDGPSRGSRSKTLRILKFGYWNRLSELRNGMAGRTVTDSSENWVSELCDGAAGRTVAGATGRHRLWNPSLGRISSYVLRDVFDYSCNDLFSRFEQQILFLEKQAEATDPTTDCHGHEGPSQGLISKHIEKLKIGNWKSTLWTS